MKNKIEESVITELSKLTSAKINNNSQIKELGIDSLDLVQAVMDLEQNYNIQFSDDELLNIKNVQDIIDIIGKKC